MDYETFKSYFKLASVRLEEVATVTMLNVHHVVESEFKATIIDQSRLPIIEPPTNEIDLVILHTLNMTQEISKSFTNIILPIFDK